MKIQTILLGIGLFVSLAACAPKDADIEKAISEKLSDTPNVQVTVHDGVATITGTCDDEIFKKNIEKSVRAVKGVKSVVNTCEIARANQNLRQQLLSLIQIQS